MKILYLTPHVPRATKVRSHAHLQGLLAAGQEVTIGTLQRGDEDKHAIQKLRDKGIPVIAGTLSRPQLLLNALRALPTSQPLQMRLLWSPILLAQLQAFIQQTPPDIVHVEHLRMAAYGLALRAYAPVIWDAVDNLEALFAGAVQHSPNAIWRILAFLEKPRLHYYEKKLTPEFPMTLLISARDQALFQSQNPVANRIQVAAFGVDIQPLQPHARAENTLILTGTMDYHPNIAAAVYFVKEILPLIHQQHPTVMVQIVGANPAPQVQQLASQHVTVTGRVDSIADYLAQATIALAPVTYGSGIQIKVLEAFQMSTPLVATSAALRSLDVRDGEEVLVGDTPHTFADAVSHLLTDAALRERIGQAGRRYVEQHHNLRMTTQHLMRYYEQVIAARNIP